MTKALLLASLSIFIGAAAAEEHKFEIGNFVLVVNLTKNGTPSSGIAFTGSPDDSALAIKCATHKLTLEFVSKGKDSFATSDLQILFRTDNNPIIHLTGGVFQGEIHAATDSSDAIDELKSGSAAAVQLLSGGKYVTLNFPLEKSQDIVTILQKTCAL